MNDEQRPSWSQARLTPWSKRLLLRLLQAAIGVLLIALVGFAVQSADFATASESSTIYLPFISTPRDEAYYGIAHDVAGEDPEQLDELVALMVEAGVRSVRMPFRWTLLEPQKGEFDWERHDRVVKKLVEAELDIVGIFVSVPTWANGYSAENTPADVDPSAYPPDNIVDFTNYVAAVTSRYRGDVDTWVVFNEPNLDKFWQPEPDPEQYVDFLCVGYEVIKAVHPEATVVGGALAGNGASIGRSGRDIHEFLPEMYAAGADGCFDVLSIHPYLHPVLYTLEDLQERINETRQIVRDEGEFRPIWINEIGWSTAPNTWGLPTVTDRIIATWLSAVYTDLYGVERIYWYNFRDVAQDPDDPEHHFGLTYFDMAPKPAFDAYRRVAAGWLEVGD